MYNEKIALEVLEYLQQHPGSGDTMEGIAKWWVMRQRISESVEAVHQALEKLRKDGAVQERKTTDGRTLYFANDPS